MHTHCVYQGMNGSTLGNLLCYAYQTGRSQAQTPASSWEQQGFNGSPTQATSILWHGQVEDLGVVHLDILRSQAPGGVVSLRLVSLIHLASWTWRNLCGWSCSSSPNRGEVPQTGQEAGKESFGSIYDKTHHHSVLLLHGVSAPRLKRDCSMLADSVQKCFRRDVF